MGKKTRRLWSSGSQEKMSFKEKKVMKCANLRVARKQWARSCLLAVVLWWLFMTLTKAGWGREHIIEAWLEKLHKRMRKGKKITKINTMLKTIPLLGNIAIKGTEKWENSWEKWRLKIYTCACKKERKKLRTFLCSWEWSYKRYDLNFFIDLSSFVFYLFDLFLAKVQIAKE